MSFAVNVCLISARPALPGLYSSYLHFLFVGCFAFRLAFGACSLGFGSGDKCGDCKTCLPLKSLRLLFIMALANVEAFG